MEEQKLCACGCGQPIIWKPFHRYRNIRYLDGHCQKTGESRRLVPRPEEIPSGVCECGCGKPTELATDTDRKRRHFKGYPLPFWSHHGMYKKGAESHKWKGGRYLHRGYVQIYAPDHRDADHFGYVPEHRVVMEHKIGRPLEEGEIVHHINHTKDDNRPENLMLIHTTEHMNLHRQPHTFTDETKERIRAGGRKGRQTRWGKPSP